MQDLATACTAALSPARSTSLRGTTMQVPIAPADIPKTAIITVRIYLILFYIERDLHSRTEIGEREINRSTVYSISAVGNRTLFGCLPLPPPPFLFMT
jgi:hypothetical protein